MRKKLMHEYSRILIEEYCFTHKTKKAEILSRLVEMSYDLSARKLSSTLMTFSSTIDSTVKSSLGYFFQEVHRLVGAERRKYK